MTATATPLRPVPAPRRAGTARRRDPHQTVVDAAAVAAGLGFGATLALGLVGESARALAAPGGLATFAGRMTGLAGTYLLLILVLLMARLPVLERAAGQDRLARWHRRIGPWPVPLIAAHALLITVGYAQSARTGFWHQAWLLVDTYPDMLAATVALGLLVMVAVASVSVVRRRLRYETWWAVHLYVYLALALGFAHQLATGVMFVGHPLAWVTWAVVWAATAGTVVVFRVGLPLWRTAWHRLRVVKVVAEGPDTVSVICRGRHLDRLRVEGGQFFCWRFLTRQLWWQAHPYSLSAMPAPPYLRLTARVGGDAGHALAGLAPGTRVAIEGPYGTFTAGRRQGDRVLLVAAGVGVTALRAVLEALPAHVDVAMILRASTPEGLVLEREVRELVDARGGTLHTLVGPRREVPLNRRALRHLVPDLSQRDVYVCGPDGFTTQVVASARAAGVPAQRIHREQYAF